MSDTRVDFEVRTMNKGTDQEFQRVFFYCPDGHDMGSVPVNMLSGHRLGTECRHYDHRRAS